MADSREGDLYWHSPIMRAIFPLYEIKMSRKVRKELAKHNFEYKINDNFETIIRKCADREETWINDDIIDVYVDLHNLGFAHSISVFEGGKLVGGLYGVSIQAAFFGESMFNTVSGAAKAAFYFLINYLQNRKFLLLDSQYLNPFTEQLGAIEIEREQYHRILQKALEIDVTFI